MTAFYWGVRLRIILLRIAHLFAARVFVPRGLRQIAIFGFRQLFFDRVSSATQPTEPTLAQIIAFPSTFISPCISMSDLLK